MRNGDAMTNPVDLDALDQAHAAATPGEWEFFIRAVDLHNAYPAMAAELRERRARDGEMVRLLRAALKSLIALREGYVA